MDDIYTTDLSEFRQGELMQAVILLEAYRSSNLPQYVNQKGLTLILNKHTCEVFLTNNEGYLFGRDIQ
jgi:hypothetical protein